MSVAAVCLWLGAFGVARAEVIQGRVVVAGARDSRDVVVYVDRIPGRRFDPPAAPVVVDQLNLKFVPHVMPILAGTRVSFPNSDEVRHNVFSPTGSSRFDLGTYPLGSARSRVFTAPGVVTLLCNVHAEMSAYLVVTETPYSAVTDAEGRFSIADVPPGKYVLRVWHERARPAAVDVAVLEQTGALVDIRIGR